MNTETKYGLLLISTYIFSGFAIIIFILSLLLIGFLTPLLLTQFEKNTVGYDFGFVCLVVGLCGIFLSCICALGIPCNKIVNEKANDNENKLFE